MGFLEKVNLGFEELAALNELIPGAAVDTQEAFKFRKISYKKQIFYSKSCSKVKKRNSHTIVYGGSDGTLKVGMIVYFLKVLLVENALPHHLAAVQPLEYYPEEEIMAGINVTTLSQDLGHHMRPFRHPRCVNVFRRIKNVKNAPFQPAALHIGTQIQGG